MVIGVTGNSGSGKSAVCSYLKQKGAYIIDADCISRRVSEKGGAAYGDIVSAFGKDILSSDGSIDRKKLGETVFNDKEKLLLLQDLTHGHILSHMKCEARRIKLSGVKVIVFDAPLLVESGLYKDCDRVWTVEASLENKLNRIIKRDALDAEKAKKRLDSQTSQEILAQEADEVIVNNGSYDELLKAVDRLYLRTCSRSLGEHRG